MAKRPAKRRFATLAISIAACAALLAPHPAAAHGELPVLPSSVWQSWTFDPFVLVPLFLAHWLYGRGVLRAWARAGFGRIVPPSPAASFLLGELALVAALVSPIDQLGGTLLSAHMVQHMLLVAIAPPLLLAGRPGIAFTWALAPRARRAILTSPAFRALAATADWLSRPLVATIAHAAALWIWHAPSAFDAALEDPWIHSAEHLSFFVTALFFWRALFRAHARPQAVAAGALAAFVTFVHSGMLGGLLSLAPRPLYSDYGAHAPLWGLTGLEDQQLAGLIMWVPIGPLYLAAALILANRLLRPT